MATKRIGSVARAIIDAEKELLDDYAVLIQVFSEAVRSDEKKAQIAIFEEMKKDPFVKMMIDIIEKGLQ